VILQQLIFRCPYHLEGHDHILPHSDQLPAAIPAVNFELLQQGLKQRALPGLLYQLDGHPSPPPGSVMERLEMLLV